MWRSYAAFLCGGTTPKAYILCTKRNIVLQSNASLPFDPMQKQRFLTFLSISYERCCSFAFPVPKADHGIALFYHMLISQRTGGTPVFLPFRYMMFDLPAGFFCEAFPQLIGTATTSR